MCFHPCCSNKAALNQKMRWECLYWLLPLQTPRLHNLTFLFSILSVYSRVLTSLRDGLPSLSSNPIWLGPCSEKCLIFLYVWIPERLTYKWENRRMNVPGPFKHVQALIKSPCVKLIKPVYINLCVLGQYERKWVCISGGVCAGVWHAVCIDDCRS